MLSMKRCLVFVFAGSLVLLAANASGLAEEKSGIRLKTGYQGYFVDGDEGRFREDRYTTDANTGGIEKLSFSGESADISYDFALRALWDYNYGLRGSISKDIYYIKLDSEQFRKYYDGSNEAWDPTLYGLTPEFADWGDKNIYADRLGSELEFGLTLPDWPAIALGWDHWSRQGQEILARGSRARRTGNDMRAIPAWAEIEGISDTFYVDVGQSFQEKYNLNLRQEWEHYRDSQDIMFPRYNADGSLQQYRTFQDEPDFTESRTTLSFSSFLSENVYLTANYLRIYLNNQTTRASIRPGLANPNNFINGDVNNYRQSDALALGVAFLNPIEDLQVSTNFRFEDAYTSASGTGLKSGTTERISESRLYERWYGESLSLTYKGVPRTILSLDADWEQRNLSWSEYEDVRSHEIYTDFGFPLTHIERDADIDFNDSVYTATVINRPCQPLKLTLRYRRKDKERDYTEEVDNSAAFYPGYLGDQERDVDEWTLKGDWRISSLWSTSIQFQRQEDDIKYDRQTTDGQELTMNRLSLSLIGSPSPKLTVVGTFMNETYDLETPVDAISSDFASGDNAYDYSADVQLFSLTGSYTIDGSSSASLTLQRTLGDGTIRNDLDEVWLGYKRRLSDFQSLELRYEFFDFKDRSGDGFDNYDGHGIYVGYELTF